MTEAKPITGFVERAWVDDGRAHSRIVLENATVEEVERMFLEEHPGGFFPGAAAYLRKKTPEGGQEMYENPLGGPPVMHTTINPAHDRYDGAQVRGEFNGLIRGEAPVKISKDGNRVIVEETGTLAQPNLAAVPTEKLVESVPLLGLFAKAARETTEYVMGTGFAGLHAYKVGADNAQAMVDTLNRRRNR